MNPLNACLILDRDLKVCAWQRNALEVVVKNRQIAVRVVLICTNTRQPKRLFKHLSYYLMRLIIMRPMSWKSVDSRPFVDDKAQIIFFESEFEGSWQKIPDSILSQLQDLKIDLGIKFGMGLLRDADSIPFKHGVLSYHHGNPKKYRGRPAGFYEVYKNEASLGAMVQRISNRLDAGEALALGHFRIVPQSYKKSLENLYRGSAFLLSKAISNLTEKKQVNVSTAGPIYRLPGHFCVLVFLCKLFFRTIKWVFYGTFYEKKWMLGWSSLPEGLGKSQDLKFDNFQVTRPPKGYFFLADAFYDLRDSRAVYCEGLNLESGKGEILRVELECPEKYQVVSREKGHHSYPFTYLSGDRLFLLPERASLGEAQLYEVLEGSGVQVICLKGLEGLRILDPTLVWHKERYWLFGSTSEQNDSLELWSSVNLDGPYASHPKNPIVLDPGCARPGGRIMSLGNQLIRFGQNNTKAYGNGLAVQEIVSLSEVDYREKNLQNLRVQGFKGPHTVDIHENQVVFDFYDEKFSFFAWWRRIKNMRKNSA